MVKVRLLRSWNTRAGLHHPPGVIEVPAEQARRMAQAVPPYAEAVVSVDATPAALALARDAGLDLAPYAGRGTGKGGRITVGDVRGWARA